MQQVISVSSLTPSMVLVREAYDRFFATPKEDKQPFTATYDVDAVGSVVTADAQISRVTAEAVEPWLRFQSLIVQWRMQRGATSSITEGALCSAYQSIIGMGPVAVPFILFELAAEGDEPDQWFWALKAITGEDPVADEDRGDFVAMAKAWLKWGKNSGYAW